MKKLSFLLFLIVFASLSLFAETSFWVGKAPYGASWSDDGLYAFTSLYEEGSVVFVSSETTTIQVQVIGPLPTTLEGRDFGLSQRALEELGIWGQGDTFVSVRLRNGSILEETEPDYTSSGWFTLVLGEMTGKEATDAYKAISRKGLKLSMKKAGDKVLVSIPYIVEYEMEEKTELLRKLGYTVTSSYPSENPYA
ncbi:MAG: hypothetical protein KBS81_06240 [Spirochaetales bacterium]|nr:hypothetical protein [Candidatus Physcosoma equi]